MTASVSERRERANCFNGLAPEARPRTAKPEIVAETAVYQTK